jgi:hypothetical protein
MQNGQTTGLLIVLWSYEDHSFVFEIAHTLDSAPSAVRESFDGPLVVIAQNSGPKGKIKKFIGNGTLVLGYWVPEDITAEQFRSFLAQEDAAIACIGKRVQFHKSNVDISGHHLCAVISERIIRRRWKYG